MNNNKILISVLLLFLVGTGGVLFFRSGSKSTAEDVRQTPFGDPTLLWPTRDSVSMLWGCVNRSGEWVIPAQYDYIYGFSCGYSPCDYEGYPAYLSVDGRIRTPEIDGLDDTFVFDHFYYGYASISWPYDIHGDEDLQQYMLIDTTMRPVLTDVFFGMGHVSANGLIPVQREAKGKWGYIDCHGQEVIPAQYDYAEDFYEDHAAACVNDAFGLIDSKGKWVIQPRYAYLWPLGHERWAALDDEGREAMLDCEGKEIVAFGKYSDYFPARDESGLICCQDLHSGYTGWIDRDGKALEAFYFDLSEPFDAGYASGIDISSPDTFSLHIVDRRGVVVYSIDVPGSYDEETFLHNGIIDVRVRENELDYSGTLLTLEGDTLHHWVCRQ